jgi:hypothetical protein
MAKLIESQISVSGEDEIGEAIITVSFDEAQGAASFLIRNAKGKYYGFWIYEDELLKLNKFLK